MCKKICMYNWQINAFEHENKQQTNKRVDAMHNAKGAINISHKARRKKNLPTIHEYANL